MYSISELAIKVQTKPHTLRYYEKEGILTAHRKENGIRWYDEQHVKWLKFVMKLRETKMPIAQIKVYTQLLKEGEHTSLARLQLLETHQRDIQNQITTLLETDALLDRKITAYKEYLHAIESNA
ncbi:MerR family transcriptional regulator [Pontibacillus salicampi]|uniref:MerR family transcriptional regulator n=1 Tax=Pontibacillus salicampi TaxID=1449801 RepID=A0ABV6LKY0_9BACI